MMSWVFAGITLLAVLMSTFEKEIRRAILSIWVAGIGVGAIYLTIGAEFLAMVQWIVSTIVTISFIFFAVMFGEFNPPPSSPQTSLSQKRGNFLILLFAIVLGAGFAAVIWLGAHELPEISLIPSQEGGDLNSIGKILTQDHLLSLEVLALTLFLVLVGGGVIARTEKEGESQ